MSNRFTSQRRSTRLLLTPLSVSCKLNVSSPNSPAAQQYNADDETYTPDHGNYPVVIHPTVIASDPNGLGFPQHVNSLLSIVSGDLTWYLNGKAIDTMWTPRQTQQGTGDFWIDTGAHTDRGTLWIYKNFVPDAVMDLCFVGKFVDWRNNQVIEIQSDHIELTCTTRAPQELKITVNKERFMYDPFYDKRLLFDYLNARGVDGISSLPTTDVGRQYPVYIKMIAQKGQTGINTLSDLTSEGLSVQIKRRGGSTALTPGSDSAPELVTFSFPDITLDARQIEHNEYTVEMIKDNEVVSSVDFVIIRKTTMPNADLTKPMRGVDIPYGEEFYDNQAWVIAPDGQQIPYPEAFYMITWYTQLWKRSPQSPTYADAKTWQLGENLQATVKGIGLLENVKDVTFDVFFDIAEHDVMGRCKGTCIESSSDPNYETEYYFTDENNNHLII